MEATIQSNSQSETFEQFMAGMKELKERMQVTERLFERAEKITMENGRQFDEVKKTIMESGRQFDETKKIIAENNRRMGDLSNSFGELAEHLVAPGILQKFRKIGYTVERTSRNIKIENFSDSKIVAEIDVLLENGDVAIVVEVKSKLRDKHLDEFLVKMKKLREYADRKQDTRKYIGAIASAIMNDEQRKKIIDEGIYVIEQIGDTMQITSPEGFVPREW